MTAISKQEIAALFFKAQFIEEAEIERRRQPEQLAIHHATISAFAGGETLLPPEPGPQKVKTVRHDQPKIGRNDPCYCGSGKKFKHCHGREL